MISNFFKIALRSIARQKLYSAINILGLTIGISASILLLLFVQDELSYDTFHTKADRIYRVNTLASIQDTELRVASTMPPLGPVLVEDYPEVLDFCRIVNINQILVTQGEDRFYESGYFFADSSFFLMFDYELLQGDERTVLREPNSIVLSQTLAKKYFGNENPIDKEIKIGAEESVRKVTGVMKDSPSNSHLKPAALISINSLNAERFSFWGNISDYTYIQLADGVDAAQLEAKFPEVFEKYISETFKIFNAKADFTLINLKDIYLKSDYDGEFGEKGSIAYIYIYSAIAIFILLIASINYMNLATACATTRAKEVGIRKVLGSYMVQLRWQFITESIVVTAIAAILSIMLVFFLIPEFNTLTGKSISQLFYQNPVAWVGFLVITSFVGIVAGSYPAFYLSSFKPASVLKGKLATGGNALLRKSLVVTQFAISLVMIISTMVVYDQLQYLKTKDLGFNKDQVIRIPLNGATARSKYEVLRTKLMQSPNFEYVGGAQQSPGDGDLNVQGIRVELPSGEMTDKVFQAIYVDQHYFDALQIKIVQGRGFLENIGRDTADAIIVNETMVKAMGWDDPIGKKFSVIENIDRETGETTFRSPKVVGVVGDFHIRALQDPIEPLVIHLVPQSSVLLARIKAGNIQEGLNYLENTWKEVIPTRPLEYKFIDQDFLARYEDDQRKGEMFAVFSILAILIACMGLFGLASYNAETKRKEIGIRKVIGASVSDIMVMVGKDFMKLVGIAIVVAFPMAFYFMDNWLQGFSYRVPISGATFVYSAVITTIITLFTIGYHSLTAATSNPAFSLKDE